MLSLFAVYGRRSYYEPLRRLMLVAAASLTEAQDLAYPRYDPKVWVQLYIVPVQNLRVLRRESRRGTDHPRIRNRERVGKPEGPDSQQGDTQGDPHR